MAWVDLETGTILGADADLQVPQEYLDALSTCAVTLFGGPAVDDAGPADTVLFQTPFALRAFVRSPRTPTEAMCGIAAPGIDARRLAEAMAATLDALGGDQC